MLDRDIITARNARTLKYVKQQNQADLHLHKLHLILITLNSKQKSSDAQI
jgi:hypothetical protein